jgi:putative MATE family efflux protein
MATVGLLDSLWLGRLGGMALAAAAVATTLRIVVISPVMGLSMGGMAVVARHIGARDREGADHALMQTILLLLAIIVPLMVLGQVFGAVFLRWMGADNELLRDALAYLRIIFVGLLFMEMLPTMNGVIRGAGHPEYTLAIQVSYAVVLIVLEPVLIFGLGPFPEMGIRGAALASVISHAVGVTAQMLVLFSGRAGVGLQLRHIRPDFQIMGRILRIAIPTAAQRFSPNLAMALLIRLVAALGNEVLTAYSVVSRVVGFLQGTSFGIGNATATLVGQNLGAGKPDRSEQATYTGVKGAIICSVVLLGLLNIWPVPVLSLFNLQGNALQVGVVAVRFYFFVSLGTGLGMVLSNALGGAGDAVSPMVVNIGSLWLLQLPLCWALSQPLNMGPQGIWIGIAIGHCLGTVALMLRFRQGLWKRIRI